jgi:hypothetical protein
MVNPAGNFRSSLRSLWNLNVLCGKSVAYPSKITCAIACSDVCVMLTAIFFTPSASAIFLASPLNAKLGRPPR